MKILCFGSCNIDNVLSVEHTVRPGETIAAEKVEIFPGGKGLNQAIAMARALKGSAIPVFHAGCIGEDGEFLRKLLIKSGADTTYLRTGDVRTGFAIIQVDKNGENSIVVSAAANGTVTEEYIDEVLSHFETGDMLVMQNEISHPDYLVDRAHEKGMQIVLNPSPLNERIASLDMKKITYLVLNRLEAETIFGTCDEAKLQAKAVELNGPKLIMTLGSKGSVYLDGKDAAWQQAYPVKAVDTTGAGDTFTGYFVAGTALGKPVKEAMDLAAAASALSVTRMGAAASIPEVSEVKAFLNKI